MYLINRQCDHVENGLKSFLPKKLKKGKSKEIKILRTTLEIKIAI